MATSLVRTILTIIHVCSYGLLFRRTQAETHSKTLSVLRYQALVICDTPVLSYRHQTRRSLKNHELLATKKLYDRVIRGLAFILFVEQKP